MTTQGCKTCSYMIPGCDKCTETVSDTGIALYQAASFGTGQNFLQCEKCVYGRYVDKPDNEAVKCTHCSSKWDGCSYCGTTGGSCERCF